jgi:hypothetical protein
MTANGTLAVLQANYQLRTLESDDPAARLDDDDLDGLIRYAVAVHHSRMDIRVPPNGSTSTLATEREDSVELTTYIEDEFGNRFDF